MTELMRVFDYNTRAIKNSDKKYSGQKYDDDMTTLHFEYSPVEFLENAPTGTRWTRYIIFNVPDDDGNPQVYEFDGYTFVLNWNITSRVSKSRRVEYQLWFVRQTVEVDPETGVEHIVEEGTDYLLSEIDSVVLKPSIPDKPKKRNIIDPEDLNVPPNPPAFVPSVEPTIIGWIELWKRIGVILPADGIDLAGVDENGHITLTLRTYNGTNDTVVTFAAPALNDDGEIPLDFLPVTRPNAESTVNRIPLLVGEISDGRSLIYNKTLGGFVDGANIAPSENDAWDNPENPHDPTTLMGRQRNFNENLGDPEYYIAEGTVVNCTTVAEYGGVSYRAGTNWVWETETNGEGEVISGHWEPLTAGVEVVTSWNDASATIPPSSLLTKTSLDDKLDDSQLLQSVPTGEGWGTNDANATDDRIPSAKLTKETINGVAQNLATHIADKSNPHEVTKVQVGLGNVDNTSDMDKPVSTAQQTALNAKLDDSQLVTSWQNPVSDTNIASEKLTKDTIDTKLTKVTSSNAYSRLYGVDNLGAQTMYNLDVGKNGSTIAWRDAQGHLVAESPSLEGHVAIKKYVDDADGLLDTAIGTVQSNLSTHVNDTNNPHSVTKAQVGLGDVENHQMDSVPTSESTNYVRSGGAYSAVQEVQGNLNTHIARTDNPHSVTKAQVGLGSVINATMDATPSEGSQNYVTSGGVFSALALKQDNMTAGTDYVAHSSDASSIYATNGSSVDTMVPYTASATGSTIVLRQSGGQITVPATPVDDTDAASKAFVNSSIGTATANFLGTYKALDDPQNPTMSLGFTQAQVDTMKDPASASSAAIATALASKISNPSINDYCFVEMDFTDPATSPDEYRRYKYSGTTWLYEYTLNNSSFTQAQWDAINSTITSVKVAQYDAYATNKLDASTVFATINGTSVKGSTAFTLQTPLTAGTDYVAHVASANKVYGTDGSNADTTYGLVTSWSSTVADTNVASEKLVKDGLDTKIAGPVSSAADHILTFSDATGKVAKDSGYTIETSVPANAVFTDQNVNQLLLTQNSNYPVVVSTGTANGPVYFNNDLVTLNPSTGALTATTFNGALDWSNVTNKPTIDAVPTDGSINAVQSDGVYDALVGKLDDSQLVTSWSGTVSNTNIPSEKLTKDTLDAKLDDTQLVTSWGTSDANATDTNIASAKLTKDTLDEKVPITPAGQSWGTGITKAYINQNDSVSAMWIANTATQYALAVRRGAPSYNFDVGTPSLDSECANKGYVDAAISTATANFLGTLDEVTDLGLTTSATNEQIATALGSYTFSTTPTNNDYVIVTVNVSTTTDVDEYRRFKYNGSAWVYEYTINNTAFSLTQWAAINSGITSSKVTTYDGYASGKQDTLISGTSIKTVNSTSLLGNGDIAVQPVIDGNNKLSVSYVDGLATVATSGSYTDLSNKPTIPAAQVQSDWDQTDTTAVDYIKNKPYIPPGAVIDANFSKTSENSLQNKTISNTLAGGTSGQVLTKSSNDDWAMVWSTVSTTDEKVKQTADSTTSTAKPILIGTVSTSGTDGTANYCANVTITASTGTLSATMFSGALTGNVTGNCSGSAGSVAYSGITSNPFGVTDVSITEAD